MSLIDAAQKKAANAAKLKGKVYETENTKLGDDNLPIHTLNENEKTMILPTKIMATAKEETPEEKKTKENLENEAKEDWHNIVNSAIAKNKAKEDEYNIQNSSKKEYIYKKVGEGKVEKVEKK